MCFWSVKFDDKTTRLKDGKGPVYLSYLLSQPGHDFLALELLKVVTGAAVVTARSSAGTAIHEKARAQYKTRTLEIQEKLLEARKLNDSGLVAALQEELEKIAGQMTADTGLGGRHRLVSDASEKARKSVSAALSRTVRQAGAANSSLASTFGSMSRRVIVECRRGNASYIAFSGGIAPISECSICGKE